MSEAAVMPRGNAVAAVAAATDSNGTARPDGRNRRAAETRRKIIEAAKVMIAETSTAPTVVPWRAGPTCPSARCSSISATLSHFS